MRLHSLRQRGKLGACDQRPSLPCEEVDLGGDQIQGRNAFLIEGHKRSGLSLGLSAHMVGQGHQGLTAFRDRDEFFVQSKGERDLPELISGNLAVNIGPVRAVLFIHLGQPLREVSRRKNLRGELQRPESHAPVREAEHHVFPVRGRG